MPSLVNRSDTFTHTVRRAAANILAQTAPTIRLKSTAPYLTPREFAHLLERIGEPVSYRRLRQILGIPICDLPTPIRRVFHPEQTDPWYLVLPSTLAHQMPRQYCIPLAALTPLFQQVATTHELAHSLEQRLPPTTVALCHRLAQTPTLRYNTLKRTTPPELLVIRSRYYRIKEYYQRSLRTFQWDSVSPVAQAASSLSQT